MKKIAVISVILLLIFSTILPFGTSAKTLGEIKDDVSTKTIIQNKNNLNGGRDAEYVEEDKDEVTDESEKDHEKKENLIENTSSNKYSEEDSESIPNDQLIDTGEKENSNEKENTEEELKGTPNIIEGEVDPKSEKEKDSVPIKENDNAETIQSKTTLHSIAAPKVTESKTSRLGHIKSTQVRIYEDYTNPSSSFTAGTTYTNAVYYIKKQAKANEKLYYLISTKPSSVRGTVGWVKAQDLSSYPHTVIDKNAKTFYVKGSSSAYGTAWGGSKDIVYPNLSKYKGEAFKVHLTEKVGEGVWYRGTLDGKTVWIRSNHVTDVNVKESKTSRLGHIRSTQVKIYKDFANPSSSFTAGTTYTNAVYYIKKQAKVNEQLYYLISAKPSSVRGIVGWVKAQDLSSYSHTVIDKNAKTFYVKGSSSAYGTAWGGSKDIVYPNLSKYKGEAFKVHLTEKVGEGVWYRGTLDGKTVWVRSNHVTDVNVKESKTSRLGHIRSTQVKIYKDFANPSSSFTAGTTYTNAVYYIKKQAKVNEQLYYLLSTKPSSARGTVGWIKAQDLSSYLHTVIDKNAKTFYVKGTSSAYGTAWGGSKDIVYPNLSKYKGEAFKVHLTEKVGEGVWYRGTLDGKTVWIRSNHVTDVNVKESKTSRLGHIRSTQVKIHKNFANPSSSFTAGTTYTNAVYYIKKQAKANEKLYYLISTKPSSVRGTVGWVKAQDLSSYPHTVIDKNAKTFYVKGTSSAYGTAWGGSKDIVYPDLSIYKGETFKVHLTEKVGSAVWYRGTLKGKTVWINEPYLSKRPLKEVIYTNTDYNLTISKMIDIQMAVKPQTDKRYKLWIREDAFESISKGIGKVNLNNWNLRRGPGTNFLKGGLVKGGSKLRLIDSIKGSDGYIWYYVEDTSGWVLPDRSDLKYFLTPSNFLDSLKDSMQFLKLSESAGLEANEINEKILKGKGILSGKAQSFLDGARAFGVNEIYLISHALLETGNGMSKLATGVKYKGKVVYNMYGIGAKDSCPLDCGSKYAYDSGWFTPELAIKGGAEFVVKNYLGVGQDTLYKMRWNPAFAAINGYATHQYATDIGWASKQTVRMYELYNLLDGYSMIFDIPKYK